MDTTILDSPVDMDFNDDGDPRAFYLNRFEHVIAGQPQVVFTRVPWWESGPLPGRIDVERWTVDAAQPGNEPHRYELQHNQDDSWRLVADLG